MAPDEAVEAVRHGKWQQLQWARRRAQMISEEKSDELWNVQMSSEKGLDVFLEGLDDSRGFWRSQMTS